ncbi:hypothetical protein TRVL_07567 [Trypanosoma vivax]|nr:hypothetical protein TRVL_07567 [Trypanosoma vivax]
MGVRSKSLSRKSGDMERLLDVCEKNGLDSSGGSGGAVHAKQLRGLSHRQSNNAVKPHLRRNRSYSTAERTGDGKVVQYMAATDSPKASPATGKSRCNRLAPLLRPHRLRVGSLKARLPLHRPPCGAGSTTSNLSRLLVPCVCR